jgi:predicted nucleic acid-binding protein
VVPQAAQRFRDRHAGAPAPPRQALAAFSAAEALVTDATVEPSTEECLRLAARDRVSAWDAEFVFVAEAAGLPLVSADRKLVRAFPGRVAALEDLPLRH